MADTTRNSYQDDKGYVEVTYQRRKDVLDSELNEAQRIARGQLAKSVIAMLGDTHAMSSADGGRVSSDGVTANQIIIKAGFIVVAGYAVYLAADKVVSGLTTPGAPRTDDVWLTISEAEVNSSIDSSIAVAKLGETTVRQVLQATFSVDEGGAAPPSSTTAPYLGGVQCVHLARIYRTASATVAVNTIVDFRSRSTAQLAAQDRNTLVRGSSISWDGTTLTFGSLVVKLPNEAGQWSLSALSVTPADGDAVGWLASTKANRFRRRFDTTSVGQSGTPSGSNDNLTTLVAFNVLTAVAGQFSQHVFVLAVRDGTQVILRDGTVLNVGDYMHTWGAAGGLQATAEADVKPLMQYRAYNGKARALIDHNGYRMGQVSELDENWRLGSSVVIPAPTGSFGYGTAGSGTTFIGEFGMLRRINGTNALSVVDVSFPSVLPGTTVTSIQVVKAGTTGDQYSYAVYDNATSNVPTTVAQLVNDTTTNGAITIPAASSNLPWTIQPGHNLGIEIVNTNVTANAHFPAVLLTCIVDPQGWLWTLSNNGASSCQRTYTDPSSGINQRFVKLTTGTAGGVQSGVLSTIAYECFMNADVAYVQEFAVRTGTISDVNNTRLFALGVQNNNGGGGNRFVYFYNQNATTNWQLRVVGSSTVDTDTGVAIAANTTYRMRLEIHGANVSTAGGSNFRIRGFINGTKVVDLVSSTLPAADVIRPYLLVGTTGAGGSYDISVGRVRRCWNHLLTQDAL